MVLGIIHVMFVGRVKAGRSVAEHIKEARQAILKESSSSSSGADMALIKARQLLSPPSSPFTPHHTSNWHSKLRGALLTIALSPKPHPTSATFLLISSVTTRGRRRTHVKKIDGEAIEATIFEIKQIVKEGTEKITLEHPRDWWEARVNLNARLQECLDNAHLRESLGCVENMCLSKDSLIVLGRHLNILPWEYLDIFEDIIITRMPSLWFAIGHQRLVSLLIQYTLGDATYIEKSASLTQCSSLT